MSHTQHEVNLTQHEASQTQHEASRDIVMLKDTGLELADDAQDIRGRKVTDVHGHDIGHVSNLFIDTGERKIRMLEIRGGGFLRIGDRHVLLPIDAVTSVGKDSITVNESRERVAKSPAYDPQLIEAPQPEYWEPYYGYYGIPPYWNGGYIYPRYDSWAEPTNHELLK